MYIDLRTRSKWCLTPIFYDLRTLAVVPSGAPTGTNRGSIG
ncbi:hypothetical protein HanIR_Chr07g0332911 [Helianthus annuus]|nr:hypothetical protein HanIR_Chr07g0332911 [Helianthus annuus]